MKYSVFEAGMENAKRLIYNDIENHFEEKYGTEIKEKDQEIEEQNQEIKQLKKRIEELENNQ